MRDEGVSDRMQEPLAVCAVTQAVVSRVLPEEGRISELAEESKRNLIGIIRSEPFAVPGHAWAEIRIVVLRLVQRCVETSAEERDRLVAVVQKEQELIFQLQR